MDKSAITLGRLRSFVRVADRGSLSAVAREHGVGQSTITRHVADLELALGITLLNRTTRRVTLTAEGARFLDQTRVILRLTDEAADEAHSAGTRLAGRIRVSCTAALGVRHVARELFAFQDQHPDVGIDLSLSDQRIDLVREAMDIAIRLGPLADSSIRRKSVGHSRRVLVASRAYLDAHGRPQKPDDLQRHQAIRMSNVEGSETLVLRMTGKAPCVIPIDDRLLVDHGLAAREAVLQGRGIAPAHIWLIDDLLESGVVEHVLPHHTLEPIPLNILIVPGRARIKRVRALVDWLFDTLGGLPGLGDRRSA